MKKALSELVALGIAGAGIMLLVGCIYFPGNYKRLDGRPRPETMIGKTGSTKQLWVGSATRAQVEQVLGGPDAVEGTPAAAWIYHYTINTGYVLSLCWSGYGQSEERFLRLDFDQAGILQRYRVYKTEGEARLMW
jgi:outer membrane protein assembly factor BamE (lipoprotein component of BamABCDE complex)